MVLKEHLKGCKDWIADEQNVQSGIEKYGGGILILLAVLARGVNYEISGNKKHVTWSIFEERKNIGDLIPRHDQKYDKFKTANNIVKLFHIILVSCAKQNMAVTEEDQTIACKNHHQKLWKAEFSW